MTNKLPAYFEKYFEQKFSDISEQIDELKKHVNDEILELKKQVVRQSWVIAFLFVLLLIHDLTKINIIDLIRQLFIR